MLLIIRILEKKRKEKLVLPGFTSAFERLHKPVPLFNIFRNYSTIRTLVVFWIVFGRTHVRCVPQCAVCECVVPNPHS